MTEETKFVRPISRFVILVDDPDMTMENGIIVRTPMRRVNLDFTVVRGSSPDFGVGDRVIIDDSLAGRKVKIDGVCYRIVNKRHIIGVVS